MEAASIYRFPGLKGNNGLRDVDLRLRLRPQTAVRDSSADLCRALKALLGGKRVSSGALTAGNLEGGAVVPGDRVLPSRERNTLPEDSGLR